MDLFPTEKDLLEVIVIVSYISSRSVTESVLCVVNVFLNFLLAFVVFFLGCVTNFLAGFLGAFLYLFSSLLGSFFDILSSFFYTFLGLKPEFLYFSFFGEGNSRCEHRKSEDYSNKCNEFFHDILLDEKIKRIVPRGVEPLF